MSIESGRNEKTLSFSGDPLTLVIAIIAWVIALFENSMACA
ncbi:hypothetical protein [Enterobacter hormaechei]